MYFLDVIGPGDPGYPGYVEPDNTTSILIISAVVLVIVAVLITAVLIKKRIKK